MDTEALEMEDHFNDQVRLFLLHISRFHSQMQRRQWQQQSTANTVINFFSSEK